MRHRRDLPGGGPGWPPLAGRPGASGRPRSGDARADHRRDPARLRPALRPPPSVGSRVSRGDRRAARAGATASAGSCGCTTARTCTGGSSSGSAPPSFSAVVATRGGGALRPRLAGGPPAGARCCCSASRRCCSGRRPGGSRGGFAAALRADARGAGAGGRQPHGARVVGRGTGSTRRRCCRRALQRHGGAARAAAGRAARAAGRGLARAAHAAGAHPPAGRDRAAAHGGRPTTRARWTRSSARRSRSTRWWASCWPARGSSSRPWRPSRWTRSRSRGGRSSAPARTPASWLGAAGPIPFAADPTLVARALANLIDNARKHGGGLDAPRRAGGRRRASPSRWPTADRASRPATRRASSSGSTGAPSDAGGARLAGPGAGAGASASPTPTAAACTPPTSPRAAPASSSSSRSRPRPAPGAASGRLWAARSSDQCSIVRCAHRCLTATPS